MDFFYQGLGGPPGLGGQLDFAYPAYPTSTPLQRKTSGPILRPVLMRHSFAPNLKQFQIAFRGTIPCLPIGSSFQSLEDLLLATLSAQARSRAWSNHTQAMSSNYRTSEFYRSP